VERTNTNSYTLSLTHTHTHTHTHEGRTSGVTWPGTCSEGTGVWEWLLEVKEEWSVVVSRVTDAAPLPFA
jgi:hypothetical protein